MRFCIIIPALETISAATAKAVDPAKFAALEKKLKLANSAVVMNDGNICLSGSSAASEELWFAQAKLTSSMPNAGEYYKGRASGK